MYPSILNTHRVTSVKPQLFVSISCHITHVATDQHIPPPPLPVRGRVRVCLESPDDSIGTSNASNHSSPRNGACSASGYQFHSSTRRAVPLRFLPPEQCSGCRIRSFTRLAGPPNSCSDSQTPPSFRICRRGPIRSQPAGYHLNIMLIPPADVDGFDDIAYKLCAEDRLAVHGRPVGPSRHARVQ